MRSSVYLNASVKKSLKKSGLFAQVLRTLYRLKFERTKQRTARRLKELESYSEETIRKLQDKLLVDLLKYAYENTGYYRSLFDEHHIDVNTADSIKRIPFLSKETIRNNKNELISSAFNQHDLISKSTGGSTGEPLEFYSSPEAGMINHGHLLYLFRLIGYKKGDIILGGGGVKIPQELLDQNIYWKKLEKGNIGGKYLFSILHLNENTIDLYARTMLGMKPDILRGHPSFYDMLATHILENNIELDFDIKGTILTAEMCSLKQRLNIEKAFSTRVYFEYCHSEVCLFCYSKDDSYSYESSPIFGYIEVLNDDGSETEIGQIGNVVVSGLINKAMPFIRYKTGDLARISYRNGGTVHFSELLGRVQSYVRSKENKPVFFNPILFGFLAGTLTRADKWQVIQNEIGSIDFYIIKGKEYTKDDEREIERVINSKANIDIRFHYVDTIAPTKSGKHLFFIQRIKV